MQAVQTIETLDVAAKTVLVRADLNVPMQHGKVTDTTRIDRLVPTIKALSNQGAKVVLLSHFGRPKGQVKPEYSLKQVVPALENALQQTVGFSEDCIGKTPAHLIEEMIEGDVLLLENLRFHAGEEANDADFAGKLAALGDIYLNDAFSVSHRAHASTVGVADLLPNGAGLLMQAELEALEKALSAPERPVLAVVGGAKISTKLELLGNLVKKVDRLVLGGGMANTFLYASGLSVGASLCETDMADQARAIMATAAEAGCQIVLPSDAVVAEKFAANAPNQTVPVAAIPADMMMLDVGAASAKAVCQLIDQCKTVVWNGPMGAFEITPFNEGTNTVAAHVAQRSKEGKLLSVAGGGDTVAALSQADAVDGFTYVSSAGGAFLEWLEGKTLPGVAALSS